MPSIQEGSLNQMTYSSLECGARALADRAIRMARQGEPLEMIKEIGQYKIFLETILEKNTQNKRGN